MTHNRAEQTTALANRVSDRTNCRAKKMRRRALIGGRIGNSCSSFSTLRARIGSGVHQRPMTSQPLDAATSNLEEDLSPIQNEENAEPESNEAKRKGERRIHCPEPGCEQRLINRGFQRHSLPMITH